VPQDPDGWAAQAAAGTTYESGARAARIVAPTLVISGTADNVVDHRNSAVLAGQIPNARLELLDGGGHLVFWERPREVAELVCEHLG
jgi:pimeloyl-ACP methyl ester carboxylesterase